MSLKENSHSRHRFQRRISTGRAVQRKQRNEQIKDRVLSILVFLVLLYFFKSVFIPLLMSLILLLVLQPYHQRMFSGRRPGLSAFLICLMTGALFLVPLVLTIAVAAKHLGVLITQLATNYKIEDIEVWWSKFQLPSFIPQYIQDQIDIKSSLVPWLQENGQSITAYLGHALTSFIKEIPQNLFSALFILIFLYCFLVQYAELKRWFFKIANLFSIPIYRVSQPVTHLAYAVVIASFFASLAQAFILGTSSLISGIGSPLLICLLSIVCSLIPVVGCAPISLGMILIAVMNGSFYQIVVTLIFGVMSGGADNVVRAWIIGNRSDMHPVIGFLSTILGLSFFGFYGLFIAPIFVGALLLTLRHTLTGTIRETEI